MAKSGNRPAPEVPGEETAADAAAGASTESAGASDESSAQAPAPAQKARAAAKPAAQAPAASGELPDQDDIDPETIPYGQTVQTKQGLLCSTADPPAVQRLLRLTR